MVWYHSINQFFMISVVVGWIYCSFYIIFIQVLLILFLMFWAYLLIPYYPWLILYKSTTSCTVIDGTTNARRTGLSRRVRQISNSYRFWRAYFALPIRRGRKQIVNCMKSCQFAWWMNSKILKLVATSHNRTFSASYVLPTAVHQSISSTLLNSHHSFRVQCSSII